MSEPTREQPAVNPEVTTAPAGSVWSRIPHHLGRARTSTVVLGLLFLAIGALYLNIRPETTDPNTAGNPGNVQQSTTPTTVPETTAPPTTTAPETTAEPEPTESTGPTDEPLPTGTDEPTGTSEPTPTFPTLTPPTAPDTSPSSPTP
jgi:hypothetical protein